MSISGNIKRATSRSVAYVPLAVVLLAIFAGCDRTQTFLIDGGLSSKDADFACGHVSVTARQFMHVAFNLTYDYELDREVTVYRDSIHIIRNGVDIPFIITCSDCSEKDTVLMLNGSGYLRLNFNLPSTLDGAAADTTYIQSSGFAYCEGKRIPIEGCYLVRGTP